MIAFLPKQHSCMLLLRKSQHSPPSSQYMHTHLNAMAPWMNPIPCKQRFLHLESVLFTYDEKWPLIYQFYPLRFLHKQNPWHEWKALGARVGWSVIWEEGHRNLPGCWLWPAVWATHTHKPGRNCIYMQMWIGIQVDCSSAMLNSWFGVPLICGGHGIQYVVSWNGSIHQHSRILIPGRLAVHFHTVIVS